MTAPLLVFGEDWGAHPSSTQHLIQRLAQDRKTLWVNSIGLRRPRLTRQDTRRVIAKGRSMIRRNQSPEQSCPARASGSPSKAAPFPVVQPVALSWPGNPLVGAFNRIAIPRALSQATQSCFGDTAPILWTSLPSAVDVVGRFKERAVVYYAGDDFGALEGVDHQPVLRQQARLVERADLILAASPLIAERLGTDKPVHLLPHGCDVSLFSAPCTPAPDLPQDRPVAGFYGSLSGWLDQDLIRAVAQRLPEWQFVFIGEHRTDLSRLRGLENVTLMGPRAHAQLPHYAAHWTASMLPFRDTEQIRACNPLKLREYLAAGQPIISTSFPAMKSYADHVHQADSIDAWVNALELSRHEFPQAKQARKARVAMESWDHRAQELDRLLARFG